MDQDEQNWWRHGIFYQVYPRSFQDSNGDGVGDIKGIIRRLPYLKSLGVDAVWLSPIFPSPMADFGYDISELYRHRSPVRHNGRFRCAGHKPRMKTASRSSLIWCRTTRPTSIRGLPKAGFRAIIPNATGTSGAIGSQRAARRITGCRNSVAALGSMTTRPDSIYYHAFLAQQPDLNWRNPAVR